eukprot:gb/GECG01010991.1/.p1 GENE.gb/GECG01010991.1/~~gb/GECG01010991.1/.p1  ORF type:complete len:478 (+),score=51.36 gb/GECG01010991.1/:1-1434(+)
MEDDMPSWSEDESVSDDIRDDNGSYDAQQRRQLLPQDGEHMAPDDNGSALASTDASNSSLKSCQCAWDPLFLAVILFGLSSWIIVNGVFAELPALVKKVPEGYRIFAWASGTVQLGNIAPFIYLQCFHGENKKSQELLNSMNSPSERQGEVHRKFQRDRIAVALILGLGLASCVLLAAAWDRTINVPKPDGGSWEFSLALIIAVFLGGMADCLSSVVYWPLVSQLDRKYINALIIGETATSLLANVLASIQAVSFGHKALFSPEVYFLVIGGVILCSGIGAVFVLRAVEEQTRQTKENDRAMGEVEYAESVSATLTWKELLRKPFILTQCIIASLENAFLTSIPPLAFRSIPHGDTFSAWGVRLSLSLACVLVLFSHGDGSYYRKLNLCVCGIFCVFLALVAILFKVITLPVAVVATIVWILTKLVLVYSKMREFQKEKEKQEHSSVMDLFRYGGIAIQTGGILGTLAFSVPATAVG